MITQQHQVTVDRCLQIITVRLVELSGLLADADEKTFEELNDMFSDCPLIRNDGFEELADKLKQWRKIVNSRMEMEIQKNNRQYLAVWGDWYTGKHELHDTYENAQKVMNFHEFTEDKGYNEEDLKAIDSLIVGGTTWQSKGKNHIVIRIK